jgi:hypothetical protein
MEKNKIPSLSQRFWISVYISAMIYWGFNFNISTIKAGGGLIGMINIIWALQIVMYAVLAGAFFVIKFNEWLDSHEK